MDLLTGVVDLPRTFAVIKEGHFVPKANCFKNVNELLVYLEESSSDKVVLKPIDGAEGRGVFVVSGKEGDVFLNDQMLTSLEFETFLSTLDDYFISEFIQQEEFAQALYADSLNTIRLLTMVDPITLLAFIAASVFRVGTSLSAPMDNFRRHGLSVAIDEKTGELGKVARIPINGRVHWFEKHPDTGMALMRQVIPHWSLVKERVIYVSDFIYLSKDIKYVGWDVVLTDSGILILEGNSVPGVSLHQVHQPLLIKPKVKRFYDYYGEV